MASIAAGAAGKTVTAERLSPYGNLCRVTPNPIHMGVEMIEVGKWYEVVGDEGDNRGRPIFVFGIVPGDEVVAGRWANGLDTALVPSKLRGPIDAVEPGIFEKCFLCRGRRMVPHFEPNAKAHGVSPEVGLKPCANCHTLVLDPEDWTPRGYPIREPHR